MKIVYFGTPRFAARILEFLVEHAVNIVGVVSQPDRPQGRKLLVVNAPVKEVALSCLPLIPIFQPEKASDPKFLEELGALQADLFVVVAYGQILSRKLLAIPPLGCVNVHASLLPRYRGAAPMQRALMNGDPETGVSIQKMVYELDAGDVIEEARILIDPNVTFGELENILCERSKELLLKVIERFSYGIPPAFPQDAAFVTYAPKISPEELRIVWAEDAVRIHNTIRALSPDPGAWCMIETEGVRKRLKILRTKVAAFSGFPGESLNLGGKYCLVAAKKGYLELLEVQLEGKKPMAAAEWMRGCKSPPTFF